MKRSVDAGAAKEKGGVAKSPEYIEQQIISMLVRDANASVSEMAKSLKMKDAEVMAWMKSLRGAKKLGGSTTDIGEEYHQAIVNIKILPGVTTSKVSDDLRHYGWISNIYETSGEHDVVAIIYAPNKKELNDRIELIRKADGVNDTNTEIVLRMPQRK